MDETSKTVVAGGCFWGMEELFREIPGVVGTVAGYSGGEDESPTYEKHDGHAEALEVEYDRRIIAYKDILDFFFRIHDPTTLNKQGNDIGTSYRSAIFYKDEDERKIAEAFIKIVNESGRWDSPVTTSLEEFKSFTPAEDCHQDYLQKNPGGYTCHYVRGESYLT